MKHIRKVVWFLGLLAALFLAVSSANAAPNMHPGQWEITTTIEMVGMPMQMPAVKTTQCLTRDDLIPKETSGSNVQRPCKVKNTKIDGNTVSWDMACSDKNQTSGQGVVTYHGDTFEGTIRMVSTLSSKKKLQMILHLKGKRVGDCK